MFWGGVYCKVGFCCDATVQLASVFIVTGIDVAAILVLMASLGGGLSSLLIGGWWQDFIFVILCKVLASRLDH